MSNKLTCTEVTVNTHATRDPLEEMPRAGRTPSLDQLLALAPAQPLGPPEGMIMRGGRCVERTRWPKAVHALHAKFPGYQPGYKFCEDLKYGDTPSPNAPLSAYVRARLRHARALWSAEIDMRRTKLQFEEWLRHHVDFQTVLQPLWTEGRSDDGWTRSFQLLRVACGLPHVPDNSEAAAS